MSTERNYYGGAHSIDYLAGDIYPSEFTYLQQHFARDYLILYKRSEFIQLMIDWMPFEAYRQGIQFIKDEGPIKGFKFGQPYSFEGYDWEDPETMRKISLSAFEEYFQWINGWMHWLMAVGWARLYDEGALIVFLDDTPLEYPPGAGDREVIWKANPDPRGYARFKVFQPMAVGTGTGFEVGEVEEQDGSILNWKVYVQDNKSKAKMFTIDADRCHHMIWRKKENSWKGSSRVYGLGKIAIAEEQTFQRLTKRAHDIAGGILKFTGVNSKTEQQALDNAMGQDLSSVDRVFLQQGRDVMYETPDLKAAGEFSAIFELFTKKLCRHMRVSQLILDGEHTGAGLGGNNNIEMMNSYSEIYQIQEHFRNDLEKVFFKLGRNDTRFVFNDILPTEMTPAMGMSMDEQNGSEETDSEENDQPEEKTKSKDN